MDSLQKMLSLFEVPLSVFQSIGAKPVIVWPWEVLKAITQSANGDPSAA